MEKVRWQRLKRLKHLSAWRFLALVATDPRYDQLYTNLDNARRLPLLSTRKPWLAMDAVHFAEEVVPDDCRVFEWGSGASTLWFEDKGCSVTSCEHDAKWYELIQKKISSADVILCKDKESYVKPKIDILNYDVFLIDGAYRPECAEFLIEEIEKQNLSKRLVIFDDSNREQYRVQLVRLSEVSKKCLSLGGANGVEMNKMTTFFWL